MPLDVVSITESAVAAAYERGLVLVRPDGHVAWRGDDLADPQAIISTVCGLADSRAAGARRPSPQHASHLS
jgi:hypothetical protein